MFEISVALVLKHKYSVVLLAGTYPVVGHCVVNEYANPTFTVQLYRSFLDVNGKPAMPRFPVPPLAVLVLISIEK